MFSTACAVLCAASAALGQVTTGPNVTYDLEDNIYGWGMRLDNFGIRCDPNGPTEKHYFSFSPGVTMTFDSVTNQAYIQGTISHTASNQLWNISATLSDPVYTNADNSAPWHDATGNNLYGGAIADLSANGRNHNPQGEHNLKNASFAADRLAFMTGETNLTLQSGQGRPAYVLPGQTNGEITVYDYPQTDGILPFMLTVGHRIDSTTDQVAGFGWLDAREPANQHGSDGLVQDYLFRVGDLVAQPNNPPGLTFTVDGGDGPVAGNITVNEGTTVTYTATGTDADVGDTLTLNTNANHQGGSTSSTASGSSPLTDSITLLHAQDSDGAALTANATVTDAAGEAASLLRNVTVLNVAPTILTSGPDSSVGFEDISIDEGTTITRQIRSTDPGADAHSFTIGGTDAGVDTSLAGIRQSNLVTSTFVDDAVVDNTFTATDDDVTTSLAGTLTVNNVVPTLTGTGITPAVRSGGGEGPTVTLEATDPGLDTVTFYIQQNGPASPAAASGFALAAASAPGDTNTIIVEATGQTTPGSTRVVSTTLGPFVGLSTHGFTVTARDEDQPGVDSNAAPLQLQVVGPVAGYTITDLDGEGNLQTRSGLPLDDSVNPGGIVHTGETIDFGVLSSIVGPHSRSLPFVLANETPNDDLGELTALSILNAAIEGPDAHQFTLFEADGVTPFDPAGHDALAPGESLELVIQFSMDDNLALKDPRNASLLIFTDQGAAFGGDGAIFQFGLTGVQIPEPSSIALWLLLGGSAIFLLVRQKKR